MKCLRIAMLTAACWVAAAESETGLSLTDRGVAASSQGKYAEAVALFQRAADVYRARGPKYDAHLGITLTNTGDALAAQGKRAEAAQALEEGLALERRSLGTDDIHTLTTMNGLAGLAFLLGDLERSKALFEEALPILRERHPQDVQLPRTLAGLSGVRVIERKLDEATGLAEEALALSLKLEGEDGLDAPGMYAIVAEAHRASGRPERALPLYRKALALYERRLGPDNPRIAQVRGQMGNALMQDGKPGMAEREMRTALEILSKTCPDCYREQWTVENNLGLLRLREGKLKEADQLLSHVLALQEKHLRHPGIEIAQTLQTLAQVREKERRFDEAAQLSSRAARLSYQ